MPAHIKSCADCDRASDCPWASPDLKEDTDFSQKNPAAEDETLAIVGKKLHQRTDCR